MINATNVFFFFHIYKYEVCVFCSISSCLYHQLLSTMTSTNQMRYRYENERYILSGKLKNSKL